MDAGNSYQKVLEEAKSDPNIIGFFLTGSRGKGLITKYSDYDADMVVKDEAKKEYKKRYDALRPDVEINVLTLSDLQQDAAWGSDTAWNRYNYTHLIVQVDKTGEIQKFVDEKGTVPSDKRDVFIRGALDGYINQVYRSIKCYRDGNVSASQFETAEEIPCLLSALFALEGRLKPYYKYLDWELTNYPLQKLPWEKNELIDILLKIAQSADITTQQATLKTVEQVFRKEGFGDVFDAWEGKVEWMERYVPEPN